MITVAILTISDSAAAGTRADTSGPALEERCRELGWQVAAAKTIADNQGEIASCLRTWADEAAADVLLTTGGTGVSPRDVTPEATREILEREIPGLAELLRTRGLEQTKFSVLSRALAGTRKRSLIVNLPGAPRGAIFSLQAIEHLIPHIVDLLNGRTAH
jgi:molybdenum cofactor synthesis domain-containing protein